MDYRLVNGVRVFQNSQARREKRQSVINSEPFSIAPGWPVSISLKSI